MAEVDFHFFDTPAIDAFFVVVVVVVEGFSVGGSNSQRACKDIPKADKPFLLQFISYHSFNQEEIAAQSSFPDIEFGSFNIQFSKAGTESLDASLSLYVGVHGDCVVCEEACIWRHCEVVELVLEGK